MTQPYGHLRRLEARRSARLPRRGRTSSVACSRAAVDQPSADVSAAGVSAWRSVRHTRRGSPAMTSGTAQLGERLCHAAPGAREAARHCGVTRSGGRTRVKSPDKRGTTHNARAPRWWLLRHAGRGEGAHAGVNNTAGRQAHALRSSCTGMTRRIRVRAASAAQGWLAVRRGAHHKDQVVAKGRLHRLRRHLRCAPANGRPVSECSHCALPRQRCALPWLRCAPCPWGA